VIIRPFKNPTKQLIRMDIIIAEGMPMFGMSNERKRWSGQQRHQQRGQTLRLLLQEPFQILQ